MNTDPTSQNRTAYDQIASRFAERNADMQPYVAAAAENLLAHISAGPNPTFPILDLGCGTGRDLAWFEAHSAHTIGADLSWGMLAEARRVARAPLCQLDMRFLPFTAESFAAVWCQAALLHLPKQYVPAALAEIRRVLAPAGLLHVAVQKGATEGFEVRPYEPVERYYAHYQPEELFSLLTSAGFTILAHGEAEARRSWLWTLSRKI